MRKTYFSCIKSAGVFLASLLVFLTTLGLSHSAYSQCNVPTLDGAFNIGTTTAELRWTTGNAPANLHCYVLSIGGVATPTGAGNCPLGGSTLVNTTICQTGPGVFSFSAPVTAVTRSGNQIRAVVGGLPPGTTLEYFVNEQCTGVAPPNNVSDCAGPTTFTTFAIPYTVGQTVVPPTCPFGTVNYVANGSFTINVTDGSCTGTYTVSATPIPGSGPGGSSPPSTTVVAYIGFGQGNFLFANAGAGTYSVTVNETSGCPLATNPVVFNVIVPNGVDSAPPTFSVTNIIGNVIVSSGGSVNLGNITLPEGSCSLQAQYFISGISDNCDSFITNPNAVTVSSVTTPASINPSTQSSASGDGFGNYVVDVNWSTGQTTLSIRATDSSGNTSTATIIANVLDNTDPVVTILGNTQVVIPVCDDQISVIYSVQVDDLCDQTVNFNNLTFSSGAASNSINFTGNNYREYRVTFAAEGTYLLAATYTDAFGNVGFFDIIVDVIKATDDTPVLIVSGNGQFTVPQCDDDVFVIFSGTVVDCQISAGDNALVTSRLSGAGAPLNLTYVDAEDNFAYFEFTGNLSAGSYLFFVTYNNGTYSVTVDHLFTVIQQPAPPINLACVGNVNVSLNDECGVNVTANMLLNGSFGCLTNDDFVVTIDGVETNFIGACGTYTYMVRLAPGVTAPFQPCWGEIRVEDKRTLFLECGTTELECWEALEIGFLGTASEMCPGCQDVNNVLIDEQIRTANCSTEVAYTSIITRTWQLTDIFGNVNECNDIIRVRRASMNMSDYHIPGDIELSCDATDADYHPSVIGYPVYTAGGASIELDPTNAALICNLLIKWTDMELVGGCGGSRKIMRMWEIIEWHCGQLVPKIVGMQLITLKDTTPPVMVCTPATDQVWTSPYSCSRDLFIARPAVSDNCTQTSAIRISLSFPGNPFIADFQGGVVTGFQVGSNILTFTAYDECGNFSTCTREIVVVDEIAPIAVCQRNTTVGLGGDGTARVFWTSFDDGSYDNCGIDKIEVRRMNPSSCDPVPVFREYVDVCCTDVTGPEIPPVMVVMRVTDTSGNTNECMVELEVQDKLPAVLVCPPNITVQCGFDLDDLSIFGKVVIKDPTEPLSLGRDPIIINGVNWGLDGYAYDNCDLTVNVTENINLSVCGVGLITRTFTAVGAGNNVQRVCTQFITVEYDLDRFDTRLRFPCDLTIIEDCVADVNNDYIPSLLAQFNETSGSGCNPGFNEPRFYDYPRFDDDECTQVGISYKDHVFEIADDACYKILREWKVIDWCYMEAFPNAPLESAITRHTQIIKIKDHTAPVITCPEDITVCSFQEVCSTGEQLTRTASATDSCTPTELLFWRWEYYQNVGDASTFVTGANTPTQSGNGPSVTRNFPVGTHVIRFLVEDRCGNTDACTTVVTVEDCKKPTPVCHDQITTTLMPANSPEDQMVHLTATMLNAGSYDNCTAAQDLEFRIEFPLVNPPGNTPPLSAGSQATFTCDHLGLNTVRLWVGDEDGNWDYCQVPVIIQNNMGEPCPGGIGGGIVAGLLFTEKSDAVEDAEVEISGTMLSHYMTGVEGMFQFNNVEMGGQYTIRPERDDNPRNGVSTLDILLIQRHILGLQKLNSPYKIIAADANNSGAVTGADLVEIRRLILGTNENFTNNKSWRFIIENYEFADDQAPLNEMFPEEYKIVNYDGTTPAIQFVGIKVGDVNQDAKANSASLQNVNSRSSKALTFELDDITMKQGNEYAVTFRSADFNRIMGYQFTLGFEKGAVTLVDIDGGALQVNESNFGLTRMNQGFITTSWNDFKATSATMNDDLFTVTFRANVNTKLSDILTINSAVTAAEAYAEGDDQLMNVALVFNTVEGSIAANEFELYQNRPNPFNNETIIGFNLPEDGTATITIYDVTGKMVNMIENQYGRGYNEVRLNRADLGAKGVLYYELRTPYATATKKMLLID